MTKTIELKTIVTADEPDRDKKYVANGETGGGYNSKPSKTDPLKYLPSYGWTWDAAYEFYTWDEYVEKFRMHFPLEEKCKKVRVLSSGQKLELSDIGNDKLEVEADGFNVLVKAETWGGTKGYNGRGFVLDNKMAGELLQYLQDVLVVED